jgi:DNA (cytosine-5)-methyltransferase 1
MPVECERLMGFPDGHTKIAWNGKPASECPDTPRYKACGNSMCCNVMKWIGMRIQQVEDFCNE